MVSSRISIVDLANSIGQQLSGDGTTLEGPALQATMSYAAANNVKITGAGRTFASASTIRFYSGLNVEDLSVIATSTNLGSGGRLLYGTDMGQSGSVRIYHSKVRVIGDASIGNMNDSMGFHLDGGARHIIEDLDVSVIGKRTLIALTYTKDSDFVRLFAHDGLYDDPAQIDDCVQAIWLYGVDNCRLISPRVSNIVGNGGLRLGMALPAGVGSTAGSRLWSRGIAVGNSRDLTISEPHVELVDQGIDVSGSAGNINIKLLGGVIRDCESHGAKFANTAYRCSIIGTSVERAGRCSVVISGPSGPADNGAIAFSSEFLAADVVAQDTGTRRSGSTETASFYAAGGTNVVAFRAEGPGSEGSYPRGVMFDNCRSIDRRGRTTRGFQNDTPYTIGSGQPNRTMPSCSSSGHTDVAATGFHEARVELQVAQSGNVDIPNNTSTAINWGVEISDTLGLHSSNSNIEVVRLEPGVWRSEVSVLWPANSSGKRSIQIGINGNLQASTLSEVSGTGALRQVSVSEITIPGSIISNVRMHLSQNSGVILLLPMSQILWRLERVR